ncbi:MAG: hypothetical protein U9Q66_03510, partial [Patescibacteria group bacterium]|nr:hypothetical protein [Patescibacteria group bacterium]
LFLISINSSFNTKLFLSTSINHSIVFSSSTNIHAGIIQETTQSNLSHILSFINLTAIKSLILYSNFIAFCSVSEHFLATFSNINSK